MAIFSVDFSKSYVTKWYFFFERVSVSGTMPRNMYMRQIVACFIVYIILVTGRWRWYGYTLISYDTLGNASWFGMISESGQKRDTCNLINPLPDVMKTIRRHDLKKILRKWKKKGEKRSTHSALVNLRTVITTTNEIRNTVRCGAISRRDDIDGVEFFVISVSRSRRSVSKRKFSLRFDRLLVARYRAKFSNKKYYTSKSRVFFLLITEWKYCRWNCQFQFQMTALPGSNGILVSMVFVVVVSMNWKMKTRTGFVINNRRW